MTLKVAIAGAGGRMGQALIEAVLASDLTRSRRRSTSLDSPVVGRDAGERYRPRERRAVVSDIDAAFRDADVLIDFTRPRGHACASRGL